MRFLEIDSDEGRVRILRGEALDDLAGAAADVEDRSAFDRIPVEDRLLLRPDRLRLSGEIPHHRLIGHFAGLGAARMHGMNLAEGALQMAAINMAVWGVHSARRRSIMVGIQRDGDSVANAAIDCNALFEEMR